MTTTIPLVMYKNGKRFIIGSIEIDGSKISGDIHNQELLERFDFVNKHQMFDEFCLVANPAVEALADLNVVVDKRVPPGEVRIISDDKDFERNEVRVLLEKDSLTAIPPHALIIKYRNPNED